MSEGEEEEEEEEEKPVVATSKSKKEYSVNDIMELDAMKLGKKKAAPAEITKAISKIKPKKKAWKS
jgi:hypothetical protein